MKVDLLAVIGSLIGFVAGNFAYAAVADQQWEAAIERSFYEVFAVVVVLLLARG